MGNIRITLWRVRVTIAAMETQEWVSFSRLSSGKTLRTAVNNINSLASLCQVPDIVVRF
jgi:hypothetical protein